MRVELEYLTRKFERVILVPQTYNQDLITLPDCEMDLSLSKEFLLPGSRWSTYTTGVTSSIFWRESFSHFSRMKSILWFNALGQRVCNWFDDFCKRQKIELSQTIFYTYWFDRVTFGIALAKTKQPAIKLISRAHRVDLYENEESPSFFPFRDFMLKQMDALYLISQHGLNYILRKHPTFLGKFRLARLGVKQNGIITKSSLQAELRIVSCSQIKPVKRMDLMAQGIGLFANRHPDLHISWDHFGGGDALDVNFPANVRAKFWGNVPNQFMIDFYQNHPIDVFLNTSSSEGIPVSIMEAIASGIPIIAPAVGGIPEIVSDENGVLLNPNPSPDDIANALEGFIPTSEDIESKKRTSQKMWKTYYDADKNFDAFSTDLINLLRNP